MAHEFVPADIAIGGAVQLHRGRQRWQFARNLSETLREPVVFEYRNLGCAVAGQVRDLVARR